MKHFNYCLTLLAALLLTGNARGQMVDCNVFLKGHYVELGIAPNGAFGSSNNPPAGYHNNVTQSYYDCDSVLNYVSTLGFVADPDMDGWSVSSAGRPNYMGDYFAPGWPQEGWALQVDGQMISAYDPGYETAPTAYYYSALNNVAYKAMCYDIVGGNISYSDTGGVLQSTWRAIWHAEPYMVLAYTGDIDTMVWWYYYSDSMSGDSMVTYVTDSVLYDSIMSGTFYDTCVSPHYHGDSMLITQTTVLDTGGIYFAVYVTFTNLSDSPVYNIYYTRTVDADNEEQWGGSGFTTINSIIDTGDGRMVECQGEGWGEVLTLGTGDTSARPFICDGPLDPYDVSSAIWTETGTSEIYSGCDTADYGVGLVFNLGTLPGITGIGDSTGGKMTASNSKTIGYFYSFRTDANATAAAATRNGLLPTSLPGVAHVQNNIEASPNPFHTQLTIHGHDATDHVLLYDMMGRSVGIYGNGSTFTVPDAPAGHYVLEVLDDKGSVKARQVVQKL